MPKNGSGHQGPLGNQSDPITPPEQPANRFRPTKQNISVVLVTALLTIVPIALITKCASDHGDQAKKEELANQQNSQVEAELQSLVNFILASDRTGGLPAPSLSEARMKKLEFVRASQQKLHVAVLSRLSQQIPAITRESNYDDWMAALSVHKTVERATHKNFAISWMKAGWDSLSSLQRYESDVEQKRSGTYAATEALKLPAEILARAGVADNEPGGPNLTGTVTGIFLDHEPASSFTSNYPVVHLRKGQRAVEANGRQLEIKKDQYFVPSYEDLERLRLLPDKSNSTSQPAGH